MRKIYSSLNGLEVHNLKNVLESRGIACEVRGEYRRSAMGEIPISESFIELWIVNDDDREEVRRILDGPQELSAVWTCPDCGESIEAAFDRCWKCQTFRP
jgi:rubrerythrin